MGLLRCFIYLFTVGLLSFFAGRIIPKKWIDAYKFPFKTYNFEKNGKLYEKLKIRSWQNKLPDMSRIFPKIIPPKRIVKKADREKLENMLHENCVAELIHLLLSVAALPCLLLWKGIKGRIILYIYILFGNIPYVIIQRYNRPRIKRLLERNQKREIAEQINIECICENAS